MLKPLKCYSIKSRQAEFLERRLLAKLYEIEKKIAGSEEKENRLFSLLMRHRTIMQRLRIVRNYSHVPKEPMFFHFYKDNNAEVNRNSRKKARE